MASCYNSNIELFYQNPVKMHLEFGPPAAKCMFFLLSKNMHLKS